MGVPLEMVEDVVQDAYLRLLNAASVGQVRDSRSYFARAAASVVLSQVRRNKCVKEEAHEETYFAQLPSPEPDPETVLDSKRRVEKVQKAIIELGARARDVVVMRRLEQLTGRQTAERMRISESAVEKHLSAAMRLLWQAHMPGLAANEDENPSPEHKAALEARSEPSP
jgi:RNA polymerase sigma-70 factor (ECF subfamily)